MPFDLQIRLCALVLHRNLLRRLPSYLGVSYTMWKPNYCAVEPTPVGRAEFSFFFIFWRRARNAQRNQQHRECSSSSTQYAWGVYFSLSSLRLFIIIPSSSLYFFPSLFASPLFFCPTKREASSSRCLLGLIYNQTRSSTCQHDAKPFLYARRFSFKSIPGRDETDQQQQIKMRPTIK